MLYRLEPDIENNVEILFFRDVRNAKDIRAKMLKGEFAATFVNASLVVDVFQLLVAVSTAFHNKKYDCMATRNLFTEIVYNLSSTRSMSKALTRFGIADDTTNLVVLIPNATSTNILDVRSAIDGSEVADVPEGIKQTSDLAQIRKVYGLTDDEERTGSLLDAIVTRMACRDVK